MALYDQEFDFVSLKETGTEAIDSGKGIIRVRHDNSRNARMKNAKRGTMVKVTTDSGRAYAILRYSAELKANQIAMEYDMSVHLTDGSERGRGVRTRISTVPFWQYGHFLANHPDPVVKYAERVGRYRSIFWFVAGVVTPLILNLIAGDEIRQLVSRLVG